MEAPKLQPHIHDTVVIVHHHGRRTRYHIFVKNHKYLPQNEIVDGWGLGVEWRGDIVLMRKGRSWKEDLVNLPYNEQFIADFAVAR